MKRLLLALVAVALLAATVFAVPTLWFRPWFIDHFYARVFVEYALRHPMLLSQLGLLDGTPFAFHADRLDDFSPEFQRREARLVERSLATLRRYDRRRLSAEQRLSADVLDWYLADQQEGGRFLFHDYPVNQLFGVQSELPAFMMSTHPLRRARDAEAYVRRVARFGVAIDQVIAGQRMRLDMGVAPPRFVMREVLHQMKAFISVPPARSPLHGTLAEKLARVPGLDASRRRDLLARLDEEIARTVYPAYRRLIECCARVESETPAGDGVWRLPNGDAYYAWCLRHHTTTDLPADTIHALGLREVARIQRQMHTILAAQGRPGGDLRAEMARLRDEPRFHFPAGDSGRARVLERYREILADADRRVRPLFGVLPRHRLVVERIPPFKEATAPGAYYDGPSIGGDRPGTFYVNLRDPRESARYEMRTLAYHEGIPGHHLQTAIAQELQGVAFFRRIIPFTAYAEGWGLYAERLALENGFHRDAFDSLGALNAELFRAVRLVVDTGIHRKRWTREQAIEYMTRNTGLAESAVTTEVERYIVDPGQACAYKVGQLEILELRRRAMDRLGARFDIRGFHDVVLTHGALPLRLLENAVDEWSAGQSRAAGATRSGGTATSAR